MENAGVDRRNFIKGLAAAGLVSSLGAGKIFAEQEAARGNIWACLLHLSFNMWEDNISSYKPFRGYRPELELSETLWADSLRKMAESGLNMVLIDLGDAVRYDSHPEIAVKNAWTPTRLYDELDKIRKLGLEPIPKLNFSTTHDAWLGPYERMVSTPEYYKVCSNLIAEVTELFDNPRFFHLGMDEEKAKYQDHYRYVSLRQGDLWWGDFYYLLGEVEKNGSRAWIWSDYMWDHPEVFFKKMPKSVVQSNWYYSEEIDTSNRGVKAYEQLEEKGYDQIPTGSYHTNNPKSIENTVKYCSEKIKSDKLMGFLQTIWMPTIEEHRQRYLDGIEFTGNAKNWFERNQ